MVSRDRMQQVHAISMVQVAVAGRLDEALKERGQDNGLDRSVGPPAPPVTESAETREKTTAPHAHVSAGCGVPTMMAAGGS